MRLQCETDSVGESNYFFYSCYFVSDVLSDCSGVAMVTEIMSKCRALCVNMILL